MNVNDLEKCCGCGECKYICPTNAISYKKNNQGFLFPTIDENSCVNCSLCVKRCTFNKEFISNEIIASFAVKHKNEEVRAQSRSGGVFTALTDFVLKRNGVVYGCVLQNFDTAVHVRATNSLERNEFRKSKYIQSDNTNIFEQIEKDVKDGLYVVYSGTSCQVNAVKDYLKDLDLSKVFFVDVVCHGVPSPKVWQDYLKFVNKKNKKIKKVEFRDKDKFGWASHYESVTYQDGQYFSSNVFTTLFYSHLILRKDCFSCPYRHVYHHSDVTIADCWGIKQNNPEFDDDKGVSLVILNSEKGRNLFESVKNDLNVLQININDFLQPPLKDNWQMPQEWKDFWEYYNNHSFKKIIKKYIPKPKKISFWRKVKIKCKLILKKVKRK